MAQTTNQNADSNDARSAIILAAIVIAVAVFCVKYGLQTLVWANARHWTSSNAWLMDVPQPLPAPTASAAPPPPAASGSKTAGAKSNPKAGPQPLRAFDHQFLPPWPGNVKSAAHDGFTEFRFDSGQVIVFLDPETQLDTLGQMKTKNELEFQQLQGMLGDQFPDTNYALYNIIYSVSPAQTSPFMQTQDAMRKNVLLLWKLSFGFDLPGGIHSFEFGPNHGFQFGDPSGGHPVAIRSFDNFDKQFRLIFTAASGSSGSITQNDIDSVLQSFQPVPLLER